MRQPCIRQAMPGEAATVAVNEPYVEYTYFPSFDVLRGVSVLLVVLAHTPHHGLDSLRSLGALGVHVFFAISGFLITYRLMEEIQQTEAIRLSAFYRRRARRILPPALLYLTILSFLAFVLKWLQTSPSEIAASLFFFRNLHLPPMPDAWYSYLAIFAATAASYSLTHRKTGKRELLSASPPTR